MVSIVIPVFDRPGLLVATLESVRDQTSPDWECLMVDDGSGPETVELMESFRDRDERFRLVPRDRPPKGAPTCRNIGKERARGRHVLFLDSDDLLAPWCLEERTREMRVRPTFDAGLFQGLVFQRELFDQGVYANKLGDPEGEGDVPNGEGGRPDTEIDLSDGEADLLARYLAREVNWHTTAPLWDAAFLRRMEWDEAAPDWQDRDFHIRSLLEGARVFVSSRPPDYFKRASPGGGISGRIDDLDRVAERARLYDRLIRKLPASHRGHFRRAVLMECRSLVAHHSVQGGERHRRLMEALRPLRPELSIPNLPMRIMGRFLGILGDLSVPKVRGALVRLWPGARGRSRSAPPPAPRSEVHEVRRRLEEEITGPRRWP